nr:translation initiation factor IF-2-like [Drosophila kikkawai]
MAFRYIFVVSAIIVLAQGSNISPVDQDSEVGVHSSGGVSSGSPRGHAAAPQSQRPASGYGSAGGSQRPQRPQGGAARRPAGGAYRPSGGASRPSGGASRPSGGASRPSGSAHGGRPGQGNPHQRPY